MLLCRKFYKKTSHAICRRTIPIDDIYKVWKSMEPAYTRDWDKKYGRQEILYRFGPLNWQVITLLLLAEAGVTFIYQYLTSALFGMI